MEKALLMQVNSKDPDNNSVLEMGQNIGENNPQIPTDEFMKWTFDTLYHKAYKF